MAEHARSTVERAVDDLADDYKDSKSGVYKPVFNDTVRTAVYVASLAASIVGLGFMMFGDAQVGGFISTAAGVVASGFGVAYNPLRGEN